MTRPQANRHQLAPYPLRMSVELFAAVEAAAAAADRSVNAEIVRQLSIAYGLKPSDAPKRFKQFKLRLPERELEALRAAANANGRSITAEALYRMRGGAL